RWRGDANDTGLWGGSHWQQNTPLNLGAPEQVNEWQTLRASLNQLAEADGFGFIVQGPVGAEVALDWANVQQRMADVYARRVVTVPNGPIFSAIATVGVNVNVWVNGTLVHE